MMRPLTIILLASLTLYACKKKSEVICYAGTGGEQTIEIIPQKDGNPFTSTANARVKAQLAFEQFETQGSDDASYNLVKLSELNSDRIPFNNLNCGIYYCRLSMTDLTTGKKYVGGTVIRLDAESEKLTVSIALAEE